MDAAVSHGGSLTVPSSQHAPRKEWRDVSENSFHNNGGKELEHGKFGQSDERTIYEKITGPLDVDFCSITIDGGGLTDETLQGRLQEISRQREELEHLETDLRAQTIARIEIMEIQRRYQSQIREYVDAATQLKDQLKKREQQISELKVTLEEKERELRSVKLDNEAVWDNEGLLREQNKELATFRRELNNSEAERTQHLKQILDLQELVREKESQFLALKEQHNVARETILYKDEQLREAQAWIARVQVDALQSTTNQSLQAELQERTEHFNQYWIALQRQFVEMESHLMQTIQHLHLELAEARGRSEIYKDGSRITHENLTDSSSHLQEHQMNATNDGISNGGLTHPSYGSFSTSRSSVNTEHSSGVPVFPPLLGMGTFLPAGQMSAFRPFVMHPQGVPHSPSSTNSIVSQSYLGNVLPATSVPAPHFLPNQQVVLSQNKFITSQLEPNQVGSDPHFSCELSADGKKLQAYHLNSQNNQQHSFFPAINGSNEDIQFKDPGISSKQYQVPQEKQETSTANSHRNAAFRCETTGQMSDPKDHSIASFNESQELVRRSSQQCLATVIDANAAPSNVVGSNNAAEYNRAVLVSPEITIPTIHESNSVTTSEAVDLLDERALLACIVRAIPAGSDGGIRISSTLPNRLGKMLAPLHWHDYKKHYGKLDDFVSRHPELFVIEGDVILLREGAQEIISATTAVAKVAAAAASSVPYSSAFPTVAVTPLAQSNRHKKSAVESKSVNSVVCLDDAAINNAQDSYDRLPVILKSPHQLQNGISFNNVQEMSDVTFLNKTKNSHEMNCLATEMSPTQPTASNVVGNGLSRAVTNVRHTFGGKQQARLSRAGVISRR